MRAWRWLYCPAIYLCIVCAPLVHPYRLVKTLLSPRHIARNRIFLNSDDSCSAAPSASAPGNYFVLHPPVKAVWDILSQYLVPHCQRWRPQNPPEGFPVLLSCSGGVDSMSMLHAMGTIKSHAATLVKFNAWHRLGCRKEDVDHELLYHALWTLFANIHVVYFDHKARYDTSSDIDVIRSACNKYGFDFLVEAAEGSIVDLANDSLSGNFQKSARDWRRTAYRRLICELPAANVDLSVIPSYSDSSQAARIFNRHVLIHEGGTAACRDADRHFFQDGTRGVVLLAHHACDNVETVLLKLLRGVHVSNLTGIEHLNYLDEGRDIVLARPFARLVKDELRAFLESVGGVHHEDSSNASSKYIRNRIRNTVIPELLKATSGEHRPDASFKALDKRFCSLGAQSRALHDATDFETFMFSHYMSAKYGLPNPVAPPRLSPVSAGHGGEVPLIHIADVYFKFYQCLYSAYYGGSACGTTHKYVRTLRFLKSIGFNIKELLFTKEWLLVPSDLTRKNILYQFCARTVGDTTLLDQDLLDHLSASWTKEPQSDVLKFHHLRGSQAICHQGTMVKACRSRSSDKSPGHGAVVYDDGQCSFRVFDNFNASIEPMSCSPVGSGFHLRLSVPREGSDGSAVAFDIRQLRDDDVVPCDSLWNRKACSVLSKMGFPQILRDELPVIALRDSNHVVCFYGVNISAPYYVGTPQEVRFSYGKQAAHSPDYQGYRIRVVGD